MTLVQKAAEGAVGTITLNQLEEHNALSAAIIEDLLEALAGLAGRGLPGGHQFVRRAARPLLRGTLRS